jgi:aldose 1-epimerase
MSRIQEFQLENNNGAKVKIINLGARLTELIIPTIKHGEINTILAYEHNEQYLLDPMFHGAIIGPVCNRIADGAFNLNNKDYQLETNEGDNLLHSGENGFHQQFWQPLEHTTNSLKLQIKQKHNENGFPGNVTIELTYTLSEHNTLSLHWSATSDQDTPLNLTTHSYFNLSGFGDIKDHLLRINTDKYTPYSEEQIPTGEIDSVDNTPLDFRQFSQLSNVLDGSHAEVLRWGGLDHNWVFDQNPELKIQAELYSKQTQLLLQVESTLPALQCYTGNQLAILGIHGTHEGICLEPQFFPNSVNQENFPDTILKANQTITQQVNLIFTEIDLAQLTN